jgi:hypothetical protein
VENETTQVFHENSEQANKALRAQFIKFGTMLNELLNNPGLLTEAYMIARTTDLKTEKREVMVLASVYDVDKMRSLLVTAVREAILAEMQQSRVQLREEEKADKVEPGTALDACYAARMGRDTLGYAHRLIVDFQHRAGLESSDILNALASHVEKVSSLFVKHGTAECAQRNHCEDGPSKCPIAERLE